MTSLYLTYVAFKNSLKQTYTFLAGFTTVLFVADRFLVEARTPINFGLVSTGSDLTLGIATGLFDVGSFFTIFIRAALLVCIPFDATRRLRD